MKIDEEDLRCEVCEKNEAGCRRIISGMSIWCCEDCDNDFAWMFEDWRMGKHTGYAEKRAMAEFRNVTTEDNEKSA